MQLYTENGVRITEDEVRKIYGDKNVKFTLKMFDTMCKDLQKLRQYRSELGKLRPRIMNECFQDTVRQYVPTTFDSMMQDFGTRV